MICSEDFKETENSQKRWKEGTKSRGTDRKGNKDKKKRLKQKDRKKDKMETKKKDSK